MQLDSDRGKIDGLDPIIEKFYFSRNIFQMSFDELTEDNSIICCIHEALTLLIDDCDRLGEFILSFEDCEMREYLIGLAESHKTCCKMLSDLKKDISYMITNTLQ